MGTFAQPGVSDEGNEILDAFCSRPARRGVDRFRRKRGDGKRQRTNAGRRDRQARPKQNSTKGCLGRLSSLPTSQKAPSGFIPTQGSVLPNSVVIQAVTKKAAGDVPVLV